MRIGVFAGSFCPVTKGHVEAIEQSARLVDKLYVVVGINAEKKYCIPSDARLDMLKRAIAHVSNAEAVFHNGMMTDFCKNVGATVMIKSIRNATDLQSVIDLCDINRRYWDGETVFVVCSNKYRHVSSSLVRELAGLGQDVSEYVPDCCAEEIKGYLAKK